MNLFVSKSTIRNTSSANQVMKLVYGVKRMKNTIVPIALNITWINAVLFAGACPPIDANTEVTVVPMLLPSKIAIAPINGTPPLA